MLFRSLLREIAVDGAKVYFDTNVSEHHHFLNEETGELLDIDDGLMQLDKLPPSPKGLRVARVDIVIRLRPDQLKTALVEFLARISAPEVFLLNIAVKILA